MIAKGMCRRKAIFPDTKEECRVRPPASSGKKIPPSRKKKDAGEKQVVSSSPGNERGSHLSITWQKGEKRRPGGKYRTQAYNVFFEGKKKQGSKPSGRQACWNERGLASSLPRLEKGKGVDQKKKEQGSPYTIWKKLACTRRKGKGMISPKGGKKGKNDPHHTY